MLFVELQQKSKVSGHFEHPRQTPAERGSLEFAKRFSKFRWCFHGSFVGWNRFAKKSRLSVLELFSDPRESRDLSFCVGTGTFLSSRSNAGSRSVCLLGKSNQNGAF